ncbi:MAG: hypothetical protein KatS3mg028_1170 [Bacteroidia bacterium]|nr:MAG: hypothetical protein KatS3mg028_1170 [Bacteroidia bacterium]
MPYIASITAIGLYLFAIHKEQNEKVFTISKGVLEPQSSQKIEEVSISHLENWGIYHVQMIYASAKPFAEPLILQKKQKFRANQFKNLQEVPVLGKKGYLFQLDKESISPETTQKLAENLQAQSIYACHEKISPTDSVVDLHIETLLKEHQSLSANEILAYQLEIFEKCLDRAIANGLSEITFIHGVGNGTLRQENSQKNQQTPTSGFLQRCSKRKVWLRSNFYQTQIKQERQTLKSAFSVIKSFTHNYSTSVALGASKYLRRLAFR